jgi:hypothetical protein
MYNARSAAALIPENLQAGLERKTYWLKTPFHTVGCHTKEGGKESIKKNADNH